MTLEKARISRSSIVDPPDPMPSTSPSAFPAEVPSRITLPDWRLIPWMSTGSVIGGSGDDSEMVLLSRSNSISSCPGAALAAVIAARSEPAPESFVFRTVKVAPPPPPLTVKHAENSDELPAASVAVAVTTSPAEVAPRPVAVNGPAGTLRPPRKRAPSPCVPSHAVLAKNSTRYVPAAVSSEPPTEVEAPPVALVRTGKFCRLFGPVSPSPTSFGVTPSPFRSIPWPPLFAISFALTRLPVPADEYVWTPSPPLLRMRLGSPDPSPPMTFPLPLAITMPSNWFGSDAPPAVVPIELPKI